MHDGPTLGTAAEHRPAERRRQVRRKLTPKPRFSTESESR